MPNRKGADMSQFYDEIMAEARETMKTAADDQQQGQQQQQDQAPQQPAEMPQDDLAASADRVLSQLRNILEASGVQLDQPDMMQQQPMMGGGGGMSGQPVININVGGMPKTASRMLSEATLRLCDPTGAIAMRLARGY